MASVYYVANLLSQISRYCDNKHEPTHSSEQ